MRPSTGIVAGRLITVVAAGDGYLVRFIQRKLVAAYPRGWGVGPHFQNLGRRREFQLRERKPGSIGMHWTLQGEHDSCQAKQHGYDRLLLVPGCVDSAHDKHDRGLCNFPMSADYAFRPR